MVNKKSSSCSDLPLFNLFSNSHFLVLYSLLELRKKKKEEVAWRIRAQAH